MNPLIFQLIYVVWVLLFAFINKKWIDSGWKIRHGVNAINHLAAAAICYFNFGWQIGIALLFVVATFFDGLLSLFRGLSFDYVSPKPKSIKDKIEKKVFGTNGMLPKILYLIIAIALNILYVNK